MCFMWYVEKFVLVFTGVIICEGLEEDAAEFVHRLKQLRWKVLSLTNAHVLLHGPHLCPDPYYHFALT